MKSVILFLFGGRGEPVTEVELFVVISLRSTFQNGPTAGSRLTRGNATVVHISFWSINYFPTSKLGLACGPVVAICRELQTPQRVVLHHSAVRKCLCSSPRVS